MEERYLPQTVGGLRVQADKASWRRTHTQRSPQDPQTQLSEKKQREPQGSTVEGSTEAEPAGRFREPQRT